MGTQAFAGELGKGENEVGEGGGICVEEIEIEVEWLGGLKGLAVEVEGAEDEGAGMVGKTGGAGRRG